MTQASLQSASVVRRKMFIKPDILDLHPNELLQLMKPVYGLSDSGDHWDETLCDHNFSDLKMEQSTGEHFFFFKWTGDHLIGRSDSYVDDILRADHKEFAIEACRTARKTFHTKGPESSTLEFTGLSISKHLNLYNTPHEFYISRLQQLPPSISVDVIRSM